MPTLVSISLSQLSKGPRWLDAPVRIPRPHAVNFVNGLSWLVLYKETYPVGKGIRLLAFRVRVGVNLLKTLNQGESRNNMHPFSCHWALQAQLICALWRTIHAWTEAIPKTYSKTGQEIGSSHGKLLRRCTPKRVLAALCLVLSAVMVSRMNQTICVSK
jgi:hypothetical protein